jgi:hypothetical protein
MNTEELAHLETVRDTLQAIVKKLDGTVTIDHISNQEGQIERPSQSMQFPHIAITIPSVQRNELNKLPKFFSANAVERQLGNGNMVRRFAGTYNLDMLKVFQFKEAIRTKVTHAVHMAKWYTNLEELIKITFELNTQQDSSLPAHYIKIGPHPSNEIQEIKTWIESNNVCQFIQKETEEELLYLTGDFNITKLETACILVVEGKYIQSTFDILPDPKPKEEIHKNKHEHGSDDDQPSKKLKVETATKVSEISQEKQEDREFGI